MLVQVDVLVRHLAPHQLRQCTLLSAHALQGHGLAGVDGGVEGSGAHLAWGRKTVLCPACVLNNTWLSAWLDGPRLQQLGIETGSGVLLR